MAVRVWKVLLAGRGGKRIVLVMVYDSHPLPQYFPDILESIGWDSQSLRALAFARAYLHSEPVLVDLLLFLSAAPLRRYEGQCEKRDTRCRRAWWVCGI